MYVLCLHLFESEEWSGWRSQKGSPSSRRGSMGLGKQWANTAVSSLQSTCNTTVVSK